MTSKREHARAHNLLIARRNLEQALKIIGRLDWNPETPIEISDTPIHGLTVLEKLGVIETFSIEDATSRAYYAITRSKK